MKTIAWSRVSSTRRRPRARQGAARARDAGMRRSLHSEGVSGEEMQDAKASFLKWMDGEREYDEPASFSVMEAFREAAQNISFRGVAREALSRVCGRGYEMDDEDASKSSRLSARAWIESRTPLRRLTRV